MGRHRSAQEKAELGERARALRADGVSREQIRRQLGVGDDLLTALVKGTPLPSSLTRPRAKDDLREAAVALRRAGRTYSEIYAELGVSNGSLSLWLRDLGRPTTELRDDLNAGASTDPADVLASDTARTLREGGWLLREIAEELGVAPKTAFVWTRGLPVPARARHGGDEGHVRMMSRRRWDRELAERDVARQAVKSQAAATVGLLTDRELDLVAATAYWCEGSKDKTYARREKLDFINSDPGVIRVWLEWLDRRGVERSRLRLNLSIHESADLAAATRFWAGVVGCDEGAIGRPSLKRHNPKTVRKNVGEAYVGCLVIRVLQSKSLYQEIEGRWGGVVAGAARSPVDVAS